MFYNMTVLFLLMCQIPARTRCIFVFRDFECIGGGVNDTVAAVGGTAQGVDVKALFFFHLPYHVRRCTEKVFLGVAVGKDGDVGHFLVFYRYLHFDIPAEGIGGTRADAVFQEMSSEIPNREHAIGIRRSDPPATPEAPHADRAARRLRIIAVGIST